MYIFSLCLELACGQKPTLKRRDTLNAEKLEAQMPELALPFAAAIAAIKNQFLICAAHVRLICPGPEIISHFWRRNLCIPGSFSAYWHKQVRLLHPCFAIEIRAG